MRKILSIFLLLSIIQYTKILEAKTLRFATLAPKGSTWTNELEVFLKILEKKTNGKLKYRVFAGGISGDETAVLRKVRSGIIDTAFFTGMGLGQIIPEYRITELPFLFHSVEERNFVLQKLTPYFSSLLEKKGYKLLTWLSLGDVHFFSKNKIETITDMKKAKIWGWKDDKMVEELFKIMKFSFVPLPITDVYMSLQTGMTDTVYSTSMAVIPMQWFTRVKYIVKDKLTIAGGAILINKNTFKALELNTQHLLEKMFKKFVRNLDIKTNSENNKAYKILEKQGIKSIFLKEKTILKLKNFSKLTRINLVKKGFYKQQLLDSVMKYITEYRNVSKTRKIQNVIIKKNK